MAKAVGGLEASRRTCQSDCGALDLGGDVGQQNETLVSGLLRGLVGGSFVDDAFLVVSSFQQKSFPTTEDETFGFRLTSVPEPSTGFLAFLDRGVAWRSRGRFSPPPI